MGAPALAIAMAEVMASQNCDKTRAGSSGVRWSVLHCPRDVSLVQGYSAGRADSNQLEECFENNTCYMDAGVSYAVGSSSVSL